MWRSARPFHGCSLFGGVFLCKTAPERAVGSPGKLKEKESAAQAVSTDLGWRKQS